MHVIKRDGRKEAVSFDKVLNRIQAAGRGLEVNPALIAQKVLSRIYNGVHTSELDELAAHLSYSLATIQPDYGALAAQIAISNHQANTTESFSEVMLRLANQVHPKTGKPIRYISTALEEVVRENSAVIDEAVKYDRDFQLDYFGFKTLERSYLLKDATGKIQERPQHMWMRVALGIWGADLAKAFETYDMMSMKRFTHATPTLFNAGTPNCQLSSCYLVAMDSDSIGGIYKTLGDCAQISKHAGGIGLHVHNVRAKGSLIGGTNGVSNGLVPMLRVYNSTARYVDQGGQKRNGSFAIYLEPWHADIEDFLRLKLNTGAEEERARDLFYAIWMNDLFMERVENGADWTLFCPAEAPGLADVYGADFRALYEKYEAEGRGRRSVPAQKLWFKILDAQIETGTPYIVYKDAVNEKCNQKNLGTIKSSNLCVAPETYILTDKGHKQIVTLVDQIVNVWNGNKWSETTVRKTGEQQKLVTVYLSNGAQITCTPYHKFLIRSGYSDKTSLKDATRIEASSLKEGMKLAKYSLEVISGDTTQDILHPYTHGFFCGDGTICNTYAGPKKRITLYGEKKTLVSKLQVKTCSYEETSQGTLNVMIPDEIPDKYTVPLNASTKCRLEWLAGLLDSDGCVCRNGTNESLQIASIHFDFLDRIRLMLQTLGVQSKVMKSQDERVTLLPDGKGGRAEYNCKALWRLLISSSALYKLKTLGLTCYRLVFDGVEPQRNAEQFVTVVAVVDNGRVDDTYCFNEPENHAGIFNGILTGNCTEITEFSSPEETAVCNLASIALPAFVNTKKRTFDFEEFRRTVRVMTRNLNKVIDINYYPTPETRRSNMRHRPIGIGVQGLADVFAMLRIPWESDRAAELNQRIFEHLYYAALSMSAELASVEGPYETFAGSPASQGILQYDMWGVTPITQTDGSLDWPALKEKVVAGGIRNSLLVAPMPTASTSQILGWNECFEPFTSNIYTRRTLAGEFIVVNKHLVRDLMEIQAWSEELKQKIIANNGSVQGISEIPASIRERYKTAYELKQRTLIDMAAARGAFICQSQSLNLFVADPTYAKLTSMHFHGWKRGLKTGIYYLRTKAPTAAQKFTVDPELLAAVQADKEQRDKEKYAADEGCTMCSA